MSISFLDTSFLFAYFNKQDSCHKQALEIGSSLGTSQENYIPCSVLAELLSLANNRLNTKKALKIGRFLIGENSPVTMLEPDKDQFEQVWYLFNKLSPHKLSFVDCELLYLANHYNSEIITFDKHLKESAKKLQKLLS